MNTDGNAEPGTGGVVQGVRALHHSSSRVLGGTTEVECGGRASHLHSHKSEHGGGGQSIGGENSQDRLLIPPLHQGALKIPF